MNRSRLALRDAGLQTDGGAPRCPTCAQLLQFSTDRAGRTTETCRCGYRGYVTRRGGGMADPPVRPRR